ncbi:MAG TPA: hypothetical protein VGD23_00480 [Sphingomicrobium sp.]
MSFLGKIRGMFGSADDQLVSDQPVRSRTFSATQFREEELARAAEARARAEEVQIDAAQVLSPAVNPVAETLMAEDAQPEVESEVEPAPVSAPPPAADPMPWDEAVGWLSQRSAETRNFVGTYWNWDYDLRVLHFLAQQPDLDAGVAAHIFWITAASEDYFPFGDDEPDSEVTEQVAWLTDFLGRRFAEGAFRPASYGFDDSWDCTRLKKRLAELHAKDQLPWSPEALPTRSTAELMSFDDIPEEEREEVAAFLARFGVY